MALNAIPGDPTANSYTDVAYADAYFTDRMHAGDWFNLSVADKEASLIWATRLLDPEIWYGIIASTTQALSHPRTGLYDSNGRLLADDIVAKAIQDAACEYALLLSQSDISGDTGLENYDGIKADVIDLRINQGYVDMYRGKLPLNVQRLLNGYIANTDFGLTGGNSSYVPGVRG